MSKVVIIGGSTTSLLTAYYLSDEGFEVTLVKEGDISENCIDGNAGMGVPEHIVTLASQSRIPKEIKKLSSPKRPFYIDSDPNSQHLKWCFRFSKSDFGRHVVHNLPFLHNLNLLNKSLYHQLAEAHPSVDFGLEKNAVLMLYKTQEAAQTETETAHVANLHGIKAQVLSRRAVQVLEPNLRMDVAGGVLYPGEVRPDPKKLHDFLIQYLQKKRVNIEKHATILNFVSSGNKIKSIQTANGELQADYLIICAEACSEEVKRKLKLPLMRGRGYSFVAGNVPAIQRPAILVEEGIAVTPLGNKVRFGRVSEIAGSGSGVSTERIKEICNTINQYYGGMQCPSEEELAGCSGFRAGLPDQEFTQHGENVLFAAGYSMMGSCLAPATAKLLTEQVLNKISPTLVNALLQDRNC